MNHPGIDLIYSPMSEFLYEPIELVQVQGRAKRMSNDFRAAWHETEHIRVERDAIEARIRALENERDAALEARVQSTIREILARSSTSPRIETGPSRRGRGPPRRLPRSRSRHLLQLEPFSRRAREFYGDVLSRSTGELPVHPLRYIEPNADGPLSPEATLEAIEAREAQIRAIVANAQTILGGLEDGSRVRTDGEAAQMRQLMLSTEAIRTNAPGDAREREFERLLSNDTEDSMYMDDLGAEVPSGNNIAPEAAIRSILERAQVIPDPPTHDDSTYLDELPLPLLEEDSAPSVHYSTYEEFEAHIRATFEATQALQDDSLTRQIATQSRWLDEASAPIVRSRDSRRRRQEEWHNGLLVPQSRIRDVYANLDSSHDAFSEAMAARISGLPRSDSHSLPRSKTKCPAEGDLSFDQLATTSSCVVCLARKPIVIAMPCCHLTYCVECSRDMCAKTNSYVKCAVCRKEVKEMGRVFTSDD